MTVHGVEISISHIVLVIAFVPLCYSLGSFAVGEWLERRSRRGRTPPRLLLRLIEGAAIDHDNDGINYYRGIRVRSVRWEEIRRVQYSGEVFIGALTSVCFCLDRGHLWVDGETWGIKSVVRACEDRLAGFRAPDFSIMNDGWAETIWERTKGKSGNQQETGDVGRRTV